MAKLSIEKMQKIRETADLTYKEIAEITGISESSITKLFGGFQVNPSIDSLVKIAEALKCEVDDFIERETEPTSPYYLDKKTAEIAQDLAERPELNAALRAMRDLPPEDIKNITGIVEKMKK